MRNAAIITADVVNSTRLEPELAKKLFRLLKAELKVYKFEFYRGDSFQAYIRESGDALHAVLKMRSIAKSFGSLYDIRSSIGIGSIKTPVRSFRTSSSEAFILSGRAFDELKGNERLRIQSSNEKANAGLNLIAYFCDYIFKHLTSKQAAVINELLRGSTQVSAATILGITQATINKHAQAAGWPEIDRLLKEYQNIITQFDLL